MSNTNLKKTRKYIVISGGVISGIGKGIITSGIGFFLSQHYNVLPIKLDGYLNSDPGTMNPLEHGEVFVLKDGSEVDMDFGHYERFLNIECSKEQSITMGKIFNAVQHNERAGKFLGKTVQMVPHVTSQILNSIDEVLDKKNCEIALIEIGGTIGDIESDLFVESLRQLRLQLPKENFLSIHLSYVPIPFGVQEQKTKPTQQSINLLQSKGIFPDIIIGRCSEMLLDKTKEKIALFASLQSNDIFTSKDLDSIYKIPNHMYEQGIIHSISNKLKLELPSSSKLQKWNSLLLNSSNSLNSLSTKTISIGICGKYTDLEDSYASIIESIKHCEVHLNIKVEVIFIDTSSDDSILEIKTHKLCAIIVPGGFGSRGIEGKIKVITYAREHSIPYLGICYGLQLAVIEFLRNVCNVQDATSQEIDPHSKYLAIELLEDQKKITQLGGTMRLGEFSATIDTTSKVFELYNTFNRVKEGKVYERHRHRFEVNSHYEEILQQNGCKICGKNDELNLVEYIELDTSLHPYFVATQAHPELTSKFDNPSPLFYGLLQCAIEYKNKH